jgi:hypothetical protein
MSMMRSTGVIVLCAISGVAGCASDAKAPAGGSAGSSNGGGSHVAATAGKIDTATYLTAIGDYKAFSKAPGFDKPQPSTGPHGETATVYINAVMKAALSKTGLAAWPDGSLIVKDSFGPTGAASMTTVMERYGSSWYFAQYSPAGAFKAGGLDADVCVSCHAGANDGLIALALP